MPPCVIQSAQIRGSPKTSASPTTAASPPSRCPLRAAKCLLSPTPCWRSASTQCRRRTLRRKMRSERGSASGGSDDRRCSRCFWVRHDGPPFKTAPLDLSNDFALSPVPVWQKRSVRLKKHWLCAASMVLTPLLKVLSHGIQCSLVRVRCRYAAIQSAASCSEWYL